MSIDTIREQLHPYAKDVKVNLSKLTTEDAFEGLSPNQVAIVALSCAYTTKQPNLIEALESEYASILSDDEFHAAKGAATIMAMNNVYYRFLHLVNDPDYQQLPAALRMTIIGKPGIDKLDFELLSLAVSAINGCGMCIESHTAHLTDSNIPKQTIHNTIRIAAIISSAAQALAIN